MLEGRPAVRRVLHVIRSVDLLTGGPAIVIRKLVREQVRQGHQIAVLATDVQEDPSEARGAVAARMLSDPDFAGVELHQERAWGRRGAWHTFAYSPQCRRWLRSRLSGRDRPDLIHIHGVLTHVCSVAAAMARRWRIPYLIEPYGSLDSRLLRNEGHHRLKRLYTWLFVARELRCAACVHPASEHEAQELTRWVAPERLHVIPHGVELPRVDLDAAKRSLLARFPALKGRRVILFMSRVEAQKRPELIVEAMARLRPTHADLTLLVAGNDFGHMQTLASVVKQHGLEDAVIFAGFLQGDLWHGAFAAADVLVLPSVDENFGLAAVEAMAHGVPAIVSPGVAAHTYVDQSGGGLTVEGNAVAIAEAISRVLEESPLIIGRRGRDFVSKNLSWQVAVERIDRVYDEILSRKP